MYSTCLHCHRALGRNESIEHFPIGRQLAFDSEKGRLWVVCRHCSRWNLTPIEERWEAVEESEKLFRAQKLRAQTDNIGLIHAPDGTTLIRIGKALRPEFAAWRYGAVFGRRRRQAIALASGTGISIVAAAALAAGVPAIALGGIAVALPLMGFGIQPQTERRRGMVHGATYVAGQDGKWLGVTPENLEHTALMADADGSLRLNLRHTYGRQELCGDRARRALSTLLTGANRGGATRQSVRAAADFIADSGDPDRAAIMIAQESIARSGDFEERAAAAARGLHARTLAESIHVVQAMTRAGAGTIVSGARNAGALHRLPPMYRVALEMAVHERSEQHALDQELAALERDWREAEEIAAIADGELTPVAGR